MDLIGIFKNYFVTFIKITYLMKKNIYGRNGKTIHSSLIVYCLAFGIMVLDSLSKPSLMFNSFFDYLLITVYFYNDHRKRNIAEPNNFDRNRICSIKMSYVMQRYRLKRLRDVLTYLFIVENE